MPPPSSPLKAPLSAKCADRHPLLGNAYDLGFQDRRKGPHLSFTFLSIDAVIAARLHPNQLPHSIHDTSPGRLDVCPRGIIDPPPLRESFMSINHGANMRYGPGSRMFSLFDLWGKPVIGGYKFPLPKLPERKKRTRGGRAGAETRPSVVRDGKDEAGKGKGKGKGKGRGARGGGRCLDKYSIHPSVAAHTAWYARMCTGDGESSENEDRGGGYAFDKYSELPSVLAHGAWCRRTGDGDDENEGRGGGHVFERYSELPSVHAHGPWCKRTGDGDDDDDGIENEERGGGYVFERYSELPSVLAHGAWCKRAGDGDEEEIEGGDDEETEEEDEEDEEETDG